MSTIPSSARAQARGFTVVEVLAVTAIIGVLAVLAVFGVRRWIASSHTAEATEMVNAIGGAQEQYRADVGAYANISGGISDSQLCPAYHPGAQGTWDPVNCPNGGTKSWKLLNVSASKPLWYGYATFAGAEGTSANGVIPRVTINGTQLDYDAMNGGSAATAPYFGVVARGDLNANGVYATMFYGSFSRTVSIDKGDE